MTKEYDPHIVANLFLETWHVSKHPTREKAREVYNYLEDKSDYIILAKVVRTHGQGPFVSEH